MDRTKQNSHLKYVRCTKFRTHPQPKSDVRRNCGRREDAGILGTDAAEVHSSSETGYWLGPPQNQACDVIVLAGIPDKHVYGAHHIMNRIGGPTILPYKRKEAACSKI